MEAPEKIWINPSIDLPKLNGVIDRESVQYIRTEAFIEKAKEWFEENFMNVHKWEISTYEFENIQSMIEDFRKYMKGE